MKNSRILLSALTAGILTSCAFGDSGTLSGGKYGNMASPTDKNIYSGTVNQKPDGAYASSGGYVKLVDGGTHDAISFIYGGYAKNGADANNNEVELDGGEFTKNVYGGRTVGAGSANGNTVTITDKFTSKVEYVFGGYTEGQNGETANGNTVIVNSKETGNIYGGYSYWGKGEKAEVNDNTVIILENAKKIDKIYVSASTGSPTSTGNKAFLIGNDKEIGGLSVLAGSNNALTVAGTNISVGSIDNFDKYFFALPSDIKNGDIMLKLNPPLTLQTGNEIGVATQGKLTNLKIDESVVLIKDAGGIVGFDSSMVNTTLEVKHKDLQKLLVYTYGFDVSLSQDKTELLATLKTEPDPINPDPQPKVEAAEESKALSEGTAGAAAAIVEAGSVMADKGISSAMAQSNNKANLGAGKTTDNFGAIGFGSSRYQTGSYVDSKSINISVGVALGQEVKYGKVLVGPFIELGYSDYETHNDFSSGHVKGDGISKYLGGGVFARYDWNSYANGHPYVEGSIRFGRNKNSFDSTDMGQSYKSNAFYYGAHLGLGYIVEFQNNSSLDFYAKYFYTHLNSDDVTTNQGANLNLDAVNSHKTRFGARYNHALNNSSEWQIKPYVGLAWEHEYKGDANARNGGYAVEAPSLEGSSGLAEIGVNIGKEKGLSADLGVAGYTGKRRGVAGNIMIKYEF